MGSKGDICKVTSFLSFERFCFPKKWCQWFCVSQVSWRGTFFTYSVWN